jgi:geranylgeranyl pyrophosphate synthase
MIFPASKYKDVLSVCEEFIYGLLSYGFFEGDTFEDFQLFCKTVERFQQLFKTRKEKMIMKVAKKTSNLMLALTALGPLHVSLNTEDGEKECSLIFNNAFYAWDDVLSISEQEEGKEKDD